MQESTIMSTKRELQESRMASTGREEEDIRHPSINTEPRTLDEIKMERAMVTAQKIYGEHPSEDFTKDAVDTATRENAPAEDAGDGNSLQTHPDDAGDGNSLQTHPDDAGDGNSLQTHPDDAGDGNSLQTHPNDVVDANFMSTKGPSTPPPTPATT